jgi:hypothetical protein
VKGGLGGVDGDPKAYYSLFRFWIVGQLLNNKKIKKTQWTAFTQNPTEHTLAYP